MLNTFVIVYLVLSIAIGMLATLKVHSAKDYVSAGRHLPLSVLTATMFATWFGSESVLGAPPTFLQDGIGGIVADPFGAAFCLMLAGFFYARMLYRRNMVTIGDFFQQKYGRGVELSTSFAILLSYLGWVSAQLIALGVILSSLSNGLISRDMGIAIGAGVVLLHTMFGGMWSVAITDFLQMVIIIISLLIITFFVSDQVGGFHVVIEHAQAAGKFANFWPEPTYASVLGWIGAFVTLALGSIPQQDVFQRLNSAKNENIAVQGTILGGIGYLFFCTVPLFLTYSAVIIDPEMVKRVTASDPQQILPTLVMEHMPLIMQVLFFGALMSAIMSTASGTLLAPSTLFAENMLKPLMPNISDRQFLLLLRTTVLSFGILVTWFAIDSNSSIFEMVENAYKVTLVAAFVPLTAGLYWPRANRWGAVASIVAGVSTWLILEYVAPHGVCPPQLAGLLMAGIGMLLGSLCTAEPARA